jgi:hypothetical protein
MGSTVLDKLAGVLGSVAVKSAERRWGFLVGDERRFTTPVTHGSAGQDEMTWQESNG